MRTRNQEHTVEDADFSEEKYYNPHTDSMQYKRFVTSSWIDLGILPKEREVGDFSTDPSTVLKQTYNSKFLWFRNTRRCFRYFQIYENFGWALSRLVTPNIRNALIGEFDFPKSPAERVQENYKNQIKSIENLRAGYFNDKIKEDIGKKYSKS